MGSARRAVDEDDFDSHPLAELDQTVADVAMDDGGAARQECPHAASVEEGGELLHHRHAFLFKTQRQNRLPDPAAGDNAERDACPASTMSRRSANCRPISSYPFPA